MGFTVFLWQTEGASRMNETTDEGVECSDEHMRLDLRATMKRSEVMG